MKKACSMPSFLGRLGAAFVLVIGVLFTGEAICAGQGTASAEPPKDAGLVDEIDVRLVEQRIIARDRDGDPVEDLTKDEIEIDDRSGRTRIAYLRPLREEIPEPEDLPEVTLFVDAPGGWPGVKTSEQPPERYVALFIDVENDPKLLRPEATADLVKFIQHALTPRDRIAVFSYDGQLHQELPFAGDKEAAINAAMEAFSREPRPRMTLRSRIDGLIRNIEECVVDGGVSVRRANERCLRDTITEYMDERRQLAEDYFTALEGLVKFLGGLEAEKTVLAVSHGVAATPHQELMEAMHAVLGNTDQTSQMLLHMMVGEGVRMQMDRLVEDALKEKVALSFIDRSRMPTGSSISAHRSAALMPGAWPVQAAYEAPRADLREIASTTGGVFISEADLLEGMNEAMELERGTYILGYYVDRRLRPDELAKVDIDCTRSGVRLSHKRAYYPEPQVQRIQGELKLGGAKPADPSSTESGEPRVFMPFALQLEPAGLGYEIQGRQAVTNFSLHLQVRTERGTRLTDSYHFVNHVFDADLYRKDETEPVTITGWIRLTKGKYRLEAFVRNPRVDFEGSFEKTIFVAGPESVETSRPGPSTEADGKGG